MGPHLSTSTIGIYFLIFAVIGMGLCYLMYRFFTVLFNAKVAKLHFNVFGGAKPQYEVSNREAHSANASFPFDIPVLDACGLRPLISLAMWLASNGRSSESLQVARMATCNVLQDYILAFIMPYRNKDMSSEEIARIEHFFEYIPDLTASAIVHSEYLTYYIYFLEKHGFDRGITFLRDVKKDLDEFMWNVRLQVDMIGAEFDEPEELLEEIEPPRKMLGGTDDNGNNAA